MTVKDVNLQLDARTGSLLGEGGSPKDRDTVEMLRPMGATTPLDVQAVRLLVADGSVVDWRRLFFSEVEEVHRFLAVNGFDVARPDELERLQGLHRRAVTYVDETFDIDLPPRVRRPEDPADLFLAASGQKRWEQRGACVVLKMMHVINHLEARKLGYHLNVSERALFEAASEKVKDCIERMGAEGLGVSSYEPSTKSEHSLLTKLISKPQVTAAQIFDKLRFRLMTHDRGDLVPVMRWLTRNLFPFNHIIAGETHNTILNEEEIFRSLEGQLTAPLPPWKDASNLDPAAFNPATSALFHMIGFVVELPIRVDRICATEDMSRFRHLGHLVLVALEFQLFDQETAEANETGDGRHSAYKGRQLSVVGQRLWGRPSPPLRPVEDEPF